MESYEVGPTRPAVIDTDKHLYIRKNTLFVTGVCTDATRNGLSTSTNSNAKNTAPKGQFSLSPTRYRNSRKSATNIQSSFLITADLESSLEPYCTTLPEPSHSRPHLLPDKSPTLQPSKLYRQILDSINQFENSKGRIAWNTSSAHFRIRHRKLRKSSVPHQKSFTGISYKLV